jgi:hypothetical protein
MVEKAASLSPPRCGRLLRHRALWWLQPLVSSLSDACDSCGAHGLSHRLRAALLWRLTAAAVPHHEIGRLVHLQGHDQLALAHLLICPACRRDARRLLGPAVADRIGIALTPSPGDTTGELAECTDHLATVTREVARRLTNLPAAGPERESMLRRIPTRQTLLSTAAAAVGDPPLCATLAERALAMPPADHLAATADENTSARLAALGLLILARNRDGRTADAEAAFAQALPLLAAPPAIHRPRASLLAALAQLRWTERRRDEAAALYTHAATLLARLGEHLPAAACHALAGLVFLELANPSRARPELELAIADLDPDLAPALSARAELALACCCANLGAAAETARLLARARRLRRRPPDAGETALRFWWEGRALILTRQPQLALPLLDAARRRLLAGGSVGEAACVSLDLMHVQAEMARADLAAGLAADLEAAFSSSPELHRCCADLDRLANTAANRSPRFHASLHSLRAAFYDLDPNLGRPDLILPAQRLADPLLAQPDQTGTDIFLPTAGHQAAAGQPRWAWR